MLIGIIICVIILLICKLFKENNNSTIVILIEGLTDFVVVFLLICIIGSTTCLKEPNYTDKTLVETLVPEELQKNSDTTTFVNYSYSCKEYSFKISNSIMTLNAEASFIDEQINKSISTTKIEHYKLTNPSDFLYRGLPWMQADYYIIYVNDMSMISRTN